MSIKEKKHKLPLSEAERQRRIEILIEKKKRKKRIKRVFSLLLLLTALSCVWASIHKIWSDETQGKQARALRIAKTKEQKRKEILEEAEKLAARYDYGSAVALLKTLENYKEDDVVLKKILNFEIAENSLVPVKIDEVTHIFYHPLLVDPDRAFSGDDSLSNGFKQWMTTLDEFKKITQAMYDNGYVLIDLHDMVQETTDEKGNVHFTENKLMLPAGKKAFVLSLDDVNYYHSYEGRGIASKIVLDHEGKPQCEYIQPDGKTVTGAYDCIPLLDRFIEEHPDASYRGAKGTIALSGYNGILGYRTDISYKTRENLSWDQKEWLDSHPDFNWDKECAQAKKVADALKKDGWKFASHTWGHIKVGDGTSLEYLKADNERWQANVAPLVGKTDTIIFAFGEDIADWHDYSSNNEKFNYLKSEGFHYFCNVDSTPHFVQIRDNYVRQSRRNLDGYRLWNDAHGSQNYTGDLFDACEVIDPKRTDMPDL